MDPTPSPQLDAATNAPTPARWRSLGMLLLLGSYPLLLPQIAEILEKLGLRANSGGTLLPSGIGGLLMATAENLGVFAVWFGLAWLLGRPTAAQLHLRPVPLGRALLQGFGWSVAIRVAFIVLLLVAVLIIYIFFGLKGLDSGKFQDLRPKVENLVSFQSLRNPVYLVLQLTLVSFGLAGLREELWRTGVLTSLQATLPASWQNRWGRVIGVVSSSVVFGLAHLPQGWGGVVVTGLIGLGLGTILLIHRSVWVAVLAHGFFDATTFVFLWLLDHFGLLDAALKH